MVPQRREREAESSRGTVESRGSISTFREQSALFPVCCADEEVFVCVCVSTTEEEEVCCVVLRCPSERRWSRASESALLSETSAENALLWVEKRKERESRCTMCDALNGRVFVSAEGISEGVSSCAVEEWKLVCSDWMRLSDDRSSLLINRSPEVCLCCVCSVLCAVLFCVSVCAGSICDTTEMLNEPLNREGSDRRDSSAGATGEGESELGLRGNEFCAEDEELSADEFATATVDAASRIAEEWKEVEEETMGFVNSEEDAESVFSCSALSVCSVGDCASDSLLCAGLSCAEVFVCSAAEAAMLGSAVKSVAGGCAR